MNKNSLEIQMVDLVGQYLRLKSDIDLSILECLESGRFIKGPVYESLAKNLESFLETKKVILCGNGTDALQIALMALNLNHGDEVIVPGFTYAATAEVIGLLGLVPVIVDVDPRTFNISLEAIDNAIGSKTRAIIAVHLFGQCAEMEGLINKAKQYGLFVIEDNAQAIGAKYTFSDGTIKMAGGMGHFGCTSFFPSKNLGCYGDGGAINSNDPILGERAKKIANHGQSQQYFHEIIGVNSRLDALQAGILNVKLDHLDDFILRRQGVANGYNNEFRNVKGLQIPFEHKNSTHVYHQYTIRVYNGLRDKLKRFLAERGIPSMIYYPRPLHWQKAFKSISKLQGDLRTSELLCSEVLSLPIHTEMNEDQQSYIISQVKQFFL